MAVSTLSHSTGSTRANSDKKNGLGGYMRRDFALSGVARQAERPIRCIACLAFVGVMGAAFWAGAIYIAETFLRLAGASF
jgi:hypothetical protein